MATLITLNDGDLATVSPVNANFAALNTEIAGSLRTGFASAALIGNVGTGEDTLHSWSIPASTLTANGGVLIQAWGFFAANGNTKALRLKLGTATSVLLNVTTAAPNGKSWVANLLLTVLSSTSIQVAGTVLLAANGTGLTPALEAGGWIGGFTSGVDFATVLSLKFTGEATTTNDIVQSGMIATVYQAPA